MDCLKSYWKKDNSLFDIQKKFKSFSHDFRAGESESTDIYIKFAFEWQM